MVCMTLLPMTLITQNYFFWIHLININCHENCEIGAPRDTSINDATFFSMKNEPLLRSPHSNTSSEHIFNGMLWCEGFCGRD